MKEIKSAIRIFSLIVLVFLSFSVRTSAQDHHVSSTKNILVISAGSEYNEWCDYLLSPINELEVGRSDIRLVKSYARISSMEDTDDLQAKANIYIRSFYSKRPDLILLIGSASFVYADILSENWPDIPVIMTGEFNYTVDPEYVVSNKRNELASRYPVSSLRPRLNATLIEAPVNVEKTVDLIQTISPSIQEILFVSGVNYQCREAQIRLERYLKEAHPELGYKNIHATNHSTDDLIDIVRSIDPNKTGLIFGSWLTRNSNENTISARHNILHVIEDSAPVFSLFPCTTSEKRSLIGFYTFDYQAYSREIRRAVIDVLDNGRQPRNMPIVEISNGYPLLNWASMDMFHFNPKNAPYGTEFIARPKSFIQRYWWVLIVAFIIGILVLLITIVFYQKKVTETASQASRMKSMFVQNMSHEIRTPLNAVVGFSQLLCLPDGMLTEEEKQTYAEYITNNSNMLTMLINDILSISDVENGIYKVNISPCKINPICRLAIKSTEHRVPAGVEMLFETNLEEEEEVATDSWRVQQILVNYLSNACKHTESGSIKLSCSGKEEPGMITFAVTDTGTGVPPEKAEAIFERFVKLNSYKQGTGLGLSICKLIAENLHGKVYLDTTYTGGARFVFSIPRVNS